MTPIDHLTDLLARLPGLGKRGSRRIVYYLLRQSPRMRSELVRAIENLRDTARRCAACTRYFIAERNDAALCPTCADPSRSDETLMVVEKEVDFEAIEKSGAYRGKYYILGGTITSLSHPKASESALPGLINLIEDRAPKGLTEIVLALSATPDGEETAEMVREHISALAHAHTIKVTVLGRGLSTGSELEYADPDTIKNALAYRHS